MQAKFQQSDYVQDRDKVFMGNFGVETFNFTTGKAKKVRNWVYSENLPPLKSAYRMTVIQNYETKYGNFAIHQHVFAVKENKRWKILWDYIQAAVTVNRTITFIKRCMSLWRLRC